MKNKLNLILITTLSLFLILSCSSSNQTTTQPKSLYSTPEASPVKIPTQTTNKSTKSATVISENANLRKTPNSNGEVIQIVPRTENVEVLKQKGAWFYVRTSGQTGWMHGNTIKLNKENSTVLSSETYTVPAKKPKQTPETAINNSGVTAKCRDGSLSYSAHRRGTCSHHGGVAIWY